MSEKGDDKFRLIKEKDYDPEIEDQVLAYIRDSIVLPYNDVKFDHLEIPKFDNEKTQQEWEFNEIRKIYEGDGPGMCGKMYFWFNYVYLQTMNGVSRPDYKVCQAEWFRTVEEVQKQKKGEGVICVKRRRVGNSWMEASDVLHDCLTIPYSHIGMNSKTEADSEHLFKKILFIYERLPDFLRAKIGRKHGLNLEFYRKNTLDDGTVVKYGMQSSVTVKAPVATAFEGLMLTKWVCDEAGKIDILPQIWSFTEPCLMDDHLRAGCPILFGTSGDIATTGGGLMHMWDKAKLYNLRRFFFAGWMGIAVDEFGNDRKEEVIRWILHQRKIKAQISPKEYNDFIQMYPLTVEEAFSQAGGGLGDVVKINAQKAVLRETPPIIKRGRMTLGFDSGVPTFIPSQFGDIIIYEHPLPNCEYLIGCLPAGEKVLTDSGPKDIESISFLDKLISKDGDYVEIKELQKYEVNESLYEFKIKNTFRTTKFTGEHPLYVSEDKKGYTSFKKKKREGLKYSHQKFNFEFKPVRDVKKGDWIKYPNFYKKEIPVDIDKLWNNDGIRIDRKINNPLNNDDFWWLVGLWLGDGHLTKHGLVISCNTKETEIINKIVSVSKNVLNRRVSFSFKNNNCVDLKIHSSQTKNFLKDNFGEHCDGKRIPEWVKFFGYSKKHSLVCGYIDSDGCITRDKRRGTYSVEIVSINLEMMESLQDILFSLGIISSTSKLRSEKKSYIHGRLVNQKEAYRVRVGHFWLNKFISAGGSSVKAGMLPKLKETRCNNMGCFFSDDYDYIYFKISDIKKSHFAGYVYNFHCETSTYLCRHITTHNCDPADHDDVTDEASDLSIHVLALPHGTKPPRIVCEFTCRPSKVKEYYEQAAFLAMYYNAKILIENNRYGMITYFKDNGYSHLLEWRPPAINSIVKRRSSEVGIRMTEDVKIFMEGLISDYIDEYCEYIPSIDLLTEFLEYKQRNTDRVISFGLALIMLKTRIGRKKSRNSEIDYNPKVPSISFQYVNGVLVRKTNRTKDRDNQVQRFAIDPTSMAALG